LHTLSVSTSYEEELKKENIIMEHIGNQPTRFQVYRHATGDTSWGHAPIWLNDRYFEFCEQTGREPHGKKTPAGWPMALIEPEEQQPFHNWLLDTYWPSWKEEFV